MCFFILSICYDVLSYITLHYILIKQKITDIEGKSAKSI